jgi:N-acetylneuraminate synthase/N,N'-diacetyllegionaminate synthase
MHERLVLMHCVSAYPTPIEQANLLSIPFLRQRYGLVIGYSNHVIGVEAVLAAVALGAQVVEVHVTDRREGREFRDHALSLEPAELEGLVRAVARVRSSLGSLGKDVQECERPLREAIRKGIVAARDLPEGAVLDADSLMYARPATQIPASELGRVVGKRLARKVRKGELITWTDIR